MTYPQIRWGILSAAKIAREQVCPALHRSKHGVVAAVASHTPGKAEAIAAPYGAKVYHDYDAMLADPDIDAIYIPLPNNGHIEWSLKSLEAGKHVLVEKPVAMKAGDIAPLIAKRDETGLFVAEAFMVTHHPQWHQVRDWVQGGKIGKLRHVQGVFSYYLDDKTNIRFLPEFGGGAMPDIGVYPSITTRFVSGQEPVAARSLIDWDQGVDATTRAFVDFPDFSLDFYVSMQMSLRQQMVFHGTEGFITVIAPFNAGLYDVAAVELRTDGGEVTRKSWPNAEQYVYQFDAFHNTVLNGAEYPCPLEFSVGNQKMVDMIFAGEMK